MKWPFIVQSTRDFSVAAGGANDIVEIDHLSLTENVLQGYQ